mmetsp:Transcript_34791/g.87107  ORF Transcript_34791/g.87107 Transcript_34791/m.87107 type:complete len:275 (-) Transcript_34791:473-1297(-)
MYRALSGLGNNSSSSWCCRFAARWSHPRPKGYWRGYGLGGHLLSASLLQVGCLLCSITLRSITLPALHLVQRLPQRAFGVVSDDDKHDNDDDAGHDGGDDGGCGVGAAFASHDGRDVGGEAAEVRVEEGAGDDADGGRDGVGPEADGGESQRVVESGVGHQRRQAQQEHDLPGLLLDGHLHRLPRLPLGGPAGDPVTKQEAAQREGYRLSDGGAHPHHSRAEPDTEEQASAERQNGARYEEHHAHGVQARESEGTRDLVVVHPLQNHAELLVDA